ncbi:oligopeptide ABC transporter substrate-binding protein [Tenuibacillus multivorans]|uniref:Peptide/nickel transport system substrate-binding protein n=1 Tax=Tenuibacillus multivorans TaxID=237069 RepID=A0A1G9X025_9BACI|nr:oligopeptide ABC transporter substrate-binding protein [Tenuibacillus multivorans]GEL77293.1 ABC transporter substrate-binding protein [Tenuibacillus multivorans]SDM89766.1 peptide/nickel transport system substrate-binding protein [Tenuibacillus multivorans]
MSKSLFGKFLFVLMLAFMLLIAACNDEGSEEEPSDNEGDSSEQSSEEGSEDEESSEEEPESEADGDQIYSIDDFSEGVSNDGEPIDGGEITYGLVTDTAFEGTLNWAFYSGTHDAEILEWFDESLLTYDENFNATQEGAATFEVDQENSSITFTINENVNWHDGEPVTAEDWAYAYEVISHPEYDGPRGASAGFNLLEGIDAYRNGEADSIAGIEVVDEKTITFHYERLTPSLLTGGIWGYPLAKHIFEGIPIADMAASDAVRQNPIGFGPFKVESIVPGESVTMVANEDYWRGAPNLDGVTIRVINPNVVVNELETGGVDLVSTFPVDQYPANADMPNVEFVGGVDQAYTYIGFKLGHWDEEAGEVVYDPENMKMGDVNLRRAMWHAVDNSAVGERFYNGLRWNATTLIPPSHPDWHDDSIEAPTYDQEEAKRILDEAGYEDVNGDGMRETPEGEELVINFASMSGGDTAEPLARYYIQKWGEVGLNVQLVDGRLIEFNSFYERVENDDQAIDIYQGAWGVGYDVDPSGLYGRTAPYNYPRYASEENDRLLQEGISEEAFDVETRQQIYSEWQQLMVEEIPVFPTLYRSLLLPANNRVVNYDMHSDSKSHGVYLHELGVTQEEPAVAE